MSAIKTRSQGPAEPIDLDHPPVDADAELEREIAFYASYHANKVNQLIHFVFIPQILWSWLMISSHVALPGTRPHLLAAFSAYRPSLALAWAVAYNAYYIWLDVAAGALYMPVMAILYLTATYLSTYTPPWLPLSTAFTSEPSAMPFALLVFFNGWVWQFFGHFRFEGRAPALTENATQALVTAPYFVHLETLFLFGWRPELHKRIVNKASMRIAAMNRARRAKAE